MNEIQIISRSTLLDKEIDVYGSLEKPLFKAKDVADWLKIKNVPDLVRKVDEEERYSLKLCRGGSMWFLTEDGLYELLMQSRKKEAKQFKKGVKKILHDIRTKGGYIVSSANETPEMIMARALRVADETIKRNEAKMRELENQTEQQAITIQAQQARLTKARPKLDYYNNTLMADTLLTTTQIANDLGMSAKALNKRLKEAGIIYSCSGQWILKGAFKTLGLHGSRTFVYHEADGSTHTKVATQWTQRGRRLIIALHHNNFDIEGAIREMSGEK